jgi:hypothetical protein
MENQSVTTALKQVLKQLKIKHYSCFSDTRKSKQAVGVKFIRLQLSKKQINQVVEIMQKKGFEFIKAEDTNQKTIYGGYYSGFRFTFYKQEFSFLKSNK